MARGYYYLKEGATGTRTTGGGLPKKTGAWSAIPNGDYYNSFDDVIADLPQIDDLVVISEASTNSDVVNTSWPNGIGVVVVSDTSVDQYVKPVNAQRSSTLNHMGLKSAVDGTHGTFEQGLAFEYGGNTTLGNGGTLVQHWQTRRDSLASNRYLSISGTDGDSFIFTDCEFDIAPSNSGRIYLINGCEAVLYGGAITGAFDRVFEITGAGAVECFDVDMSGVVAGAQPLMVVAHQNRNAYGYFYKCKLPSGWTYDASATSMNSGIVVESCDSEHQYYYQTRFGIVSFETDVYYTTDTLLPDGVTKGSYLFEGDATSLITDINPLWLCHPRKPRWIIGEYSGSGALETARIKFCSLSGETFDTKDIVVRLFYPNGTTSYHDDMTFHLVSPIEDGAALSTETGAWTGTGLGTQYYLDMPMTSPSNGLVRAQVGFTNNSAVTTRQLYLSPQIDFVI